MWYQVSLWDPTHGFIFSCSFYEECNAKATQKTKLVLYRLHTGNVHESIARYVWNQLAESVSIFLVNHSQYAIQETVFLPELALCFILLGFLWFFFPPEPAYCLLYCLPVCKLCWHGSAKGELSQINFCRDNLACPGVAITP